MKTFQTALELPDGVREIQCGAAELVSDAAAPGNHAARLLQSGPVPHLRRFLRGDFDPSAAASYFPVDREAGFILLCYRAAARRFRDPRSSAMGDARHRREHGLQAPYA